MLAFLIWGLRLASVVLAISGGASLWHSAPPSLPAFQAALRLSSECRLHAMTRNVQSPDWIRRQHQLLAQCPPSPRLAWDADLRLRGILLVIAATNFLLIAELISFIARRQRLDDLLLHVHRPQD